MGNCLYKGGQSPSAGGGTNLGHAKVFLNSVGLEIYTQAFEIAGYDDVELLATLEEKDLAQIEEYSKVPILPGHRKKILSASSVLTPEDVAQVKSLAMEQAVQDVLHRITAPAPSPLADTQGLPSPQPTLSSHPPSLMSGQRPHSHRVLSSSSGRVLAPDLNGLPVTRLTVDACGQRMSEQQDERAGAPLNRDLGRSQHHAKHLSLQDEVTQRLQEEMNFRLSLQDEYPGHRIVQGVSQLQVVAKRSNQEGDEDDGVGMNTPTPAEPHPPQRPRPGVLPVPSMGSMTSTTTASVSKDIKDTESVASQAPSRRDNPPVSSFHRRVGKPPALDMDTISSSSQPSGSTEAAVGDALSAYRQHLPRLNTVPKEPVGGGQGLHAAAVVVSNPGSRTSSPLYTIHSGEPTALTGILSLEDAMEEMQKYVHQTPETGTFRRHSRHPSLEDLSPLQGDAKATYHARAGWSGLQRGEANCNSAPALSSMELTLADRISPAVDKRAAWTPSSKNGVEESRCRVVPEAEGGPAAPPLISLLPAQQSDMGSASGDCDPQDSKGQDGACTRSGREALLAAVKRCEQDIEDRLDRLRSARITEEESCANDGHHEPSDRTVLSPDVDNTTRCPQTSSCRAPRGESVVTSSQLGPQPVPGHQLPRSALGSGLQISSGNEAVLLVRDVSPQLLEVQQNIERRLHTLANAGAT